MTAEISAIYRYPIKGLSPDPLDTVRLEPGKTLPADRLYAIENGPSGFDPADPRYFPKARFLMLMRNARLAGLRTNYDEASHTLTIRHNNADAVRADLRTKEGRHAVEDFFRSFMPDELRGPPRVLHAEGHSFSDVARKVVSIINLASVAQIETFAGAPIDPLRFRGNVYVSHWSAWREFDLIGEEIGFGASVRMKIVKRIVRCAATEVDPVTAERDIKVPQILMQNFGHMDCGVYAEVISGGEIAIGDALQEPQKLL